MIYTRIWRRLLLGAALAAATAVADPTGELPAVTVEGRHPVIEQRAATWVTRLLEHQSTLESLSRWTVPICPLVGGLSREAGEYVLARLTHQMQKVGALVAGEHCDVNLFVIATPQPETFLRAWRHKDPRLYGDGYEPRIKRFLADGRPVKVWRNVTHESPGAADSAQDIPAAGLSGNYGGARATQSYIATRLTFTEVRTYASVIAVVDPRALNGLSLSALADYIVFTTLAEVDPDAHVDGAPSILSLFRHGRYDPSAPTELTEWDVAFLQGLYHTDPRTTLQRVDIARHMAGQLNGATGSP